MAGTYVRGNKLYIAGRDLSSTWTAINLSVGRETIDWTKGDDTTRVMKAGLLTGALEVEGIIDFADEGVDERLYEALDSLTDAIAIVGLPGTTSGDVGTAGYALKANVGDYSPFPGAQIGERANYTASLRANGRVARGTFMHDGDTARTASGDRDALQLGAVLSTQRVFACIMCLSASAGDTLDVIIESDSAEAFDASPETRITFDQITTTGQYEWVELAGAITDDWWRVSDTIAGNGSESFSYVVLFAICNAP